MEKMAALLQLLQEESVEVLLFLKSVEELEVFEWHPGQTTPMLRFSCKLQNAGPHLRAQRSQFQLAAKVREPAVLAAAIFAILIHEASPWHL